ncbi:SH2 domain-containing protein 6 [Nerophis lumbriciformis]|uniref:SH2 domain-containing protein 6 n=1 Tax=Nerophis lumbriciformis TaxID=546530 RepID=UPI002ADF1715|nr:B-cell linker protein-like [Nerophis lumbriciformis]
MKMSFFGKLKNIGPPPAPPRRTGQSDAFGRRQHTFQEEEEEGDMYEAPPCGRPPVNVAQKQVEENVYMERTTSSSIPQRMAAPPPRLGTRPQKPLQHPKESGVDSNTKKPPEVDRNEKPGRKKMTPPPPPAALFLTSDMEEDVYLNPNEEQGDNEDLYLEPAAACPPCPRGPIRMSSSTKTSLTPSPIMKPPVPRAKSNSFLPSLIEVKTAPTFEARASTFPSKPPPTMPGFKPPLPAMLSPLNPCLTDMKHATFGGARVTEETENEDPVWFAGDCNRKTAEDLLLRVNTDGTFLIRHSSAQTARQPFTLAVLYQQKVYNVPIRFLEEMQGFALGKEGKKSEEVFSSLDEMVMHHKMYQLYLIDSKSQAKHAVFLTHPARP